MHPAANSCNLPTTSRDGVRPRSRRTPPVLGSGDPRCGRRHCCPNRLTNRQQRPIEEFVVRRTPGFSGGGEHVECPAKLDRSTLYTGRVAVALRTNANIAFQCAFHVVWCPKYRRRVIGGRMEERLKELIREVIEEKGAWLVELETMPDHVHLLVEVDPQYGVHRLVKAVKGRTSRVLREEFPWLRTRLPTLWTNSYFVATVGGAPLSVVKRYVEQQKTR